MESVVGKMMKRYSIAFFGFLAFQMLIFSTDANAINGCLATGINGGCISCAGSNCKLTGPSGVIGDRTITFDGGVLQANCNSSGCTPNLSTGNFGGGACLAGRSACFTCNTSGCNLSRITAQSLLSNTFGGLNLNNVLNVGGLGQLVDFNGVNINNILPSLQGLDPRQLENLLNVNPDLSRLIGSSGLDANVLNGFDLPGLTDQSRNLLNIPGIGGGGPIGSGSGGEGQRALSGYNETSPNAQLAGNVADQIYGNPEKIEPLKQFDGSPSAERGLGGAPILFDPKSENLEIRYPELVDESNNGNSRYAPDLDGDIFSFKAAQNSRPSFAALELGSDYEIRKSSWGVFQPIPTIQNKLSESDSGRDEFLDRYKSALGIAKTTLSFLDPTVAASLHQVQSQLDAGTTNSLLKQATWSLDQLANPQNSIIHADVNEKLMACLSGITEGADGRVIFEEGGKCTEPIEKGGCGLTSLNFNNVSYSVCQCCAETSNSVNMTLSDGNASEGYSLVDRVFYGTKKGNAGGDLQAAVDEVVLAFRELYGDVLMKSDGSDVITVSYKLPTVSLPQKIGQLRDAKGLEGCSTLSCPQTQQKIVHGICPSIIKMMTGFKDDGKLANREEYEIEASLGTILTAGNYEQMLMLAGVRYEDLDENWQPTKDDGQGAFVKWLDNFCDASAYVAMNKLHTNLKAVVYDHIQLNSYATPEEKSQMLRLMDRFSAKFALAESGVGKEHYLHDMLGSLGVRADRQELAGVQNLTILANRNGGAGATSFGGVPGVAE